MKKLFLYISLVLIICNIALAQSSLPECKGNDENISKFSIKHLNEMIKWRNCHGTAISPKGQKYIGEFYDGKFHGQGIFRHEGREYVGQWKDGKKHGQGTYSFANGDRYVGEWKNNEYFGKGIYTYANGDKYVGEWKKGSRHGKGIFIHANGKVEEGIFKNNKFVKKK